jgi:arylsulfatase
LSDRQGPRTGRWRLFNLRDDRTETNDLADKMPEKVAEMEKKYFEWSARAKILELEELKKLWKIQ